MLELPETDGCYFCDVIDGRSDRWSVIGETSLTITLLNGRQFEVGQCVIVPIRHAPTLLDMTEAESTEVMAAARTVASAMIAAFGPDGILLYQNNGVGSGQEVPHFHLHVVPRRPGSDWGFGPPHLAKVERRSHAHNHRVVTDEKRRTVETLKRWMPG